MAHIYPSVCSKKVIHIAARAGVRPSTKDPKLYFTTIIDGTFNLLDACCYHKVGRFTFASSSSVYGVNKNVPFSESDALERTISLYADISKAKALLGYESQTPIKLGIKKYVEWLKMT